MASIKIIAEDEMNIEFTKEEISSLRLPGISLGHLMIFRDKMAELFKIEPLPTLYKDGVIDRLFEVHYAAKFLVEVINFVTNAPETELDRQRFAINQTEIWSWIWHILNDEYKFDHYVVNMLTGEIYIDPDKDSA